MILSLSMIDRYTTSRQTAGLGHQAIDDQLMMTINFETFWQASAYQP